MARSKEKGSMAERRHSRGQTDLAKSKGTGILDLVGLIGIDCRKLHNFRGCIFFVCRIAVITTYLRGGRRNDPSRLFLLMHLFIKWVFITLYFWTVLSSMSILKILWVKWHYSFFTDKETEAPDGFENQNSEEKKQKEPEQVISPLLSFNK